MANHLPNDRAGRSPNVPAPRSAVDPPSMRYPGFADDPKQRRGDERSEASGNRIGARPVRGSPNRHVAVYVRCGDGDRQSGERRIDALLAYAGSHLPVPVTVAAFVDDGCAILPRSGLSRLLQEISAGKIDMVLVECLDDLSRDPTDLELLFDAFERAGLGLFTPEGQVRREEVVVSGLMARAYRDMRRRRQPTAARTARSFTRVGVADAPDEKVMTS